MEPSNEMILTPIVQMVVQILVKLKMDMYASENLAFEKFDLVVLFLMMIKIAVMTVELGFIQQMVQLLE